MLPLGISKTKLRSSRNKDETCLIERKMIMRINLEKFPFSRVLFTYCIGYYDRNDQPCFMADANIVNVVYKNNNLAFDLYSSNLEERFKEIND